MKIDLRCKCGAELRLEDARGVYAYNGGVADEQGRKFLIELRSDEWQTRHLECLKKGTP